MLMIFNLEGHSKSIQNNENFNRAMNQWYFVLEQAGRENYPLLQSFCLLF